MTDQKETEAINLNHQKFNKKITELTTQFYDGNGKNFIFKNNQKMECAMTITKDIGIEVLIQKTVYIIPNTNSVFIDYTCFKLYAIPDHYEKIVNYILSLFHYCIDNYGDFNIHINIDSFTVSAAERYKSIIDLFIKTCMIANRGYCAKLKAMYIYNTPQTFQNISKMFGSFADPMLKDKIIMYDKKNSAYSLCSLLQI
jgi:spore maturation protein SpmB